MSELMELSMPWWQFVLRGAMCYVGLLVLLRLNGKRAFGEMSPFDIVVLILVGGALRSAMVGKDTSLLGPFIAVITILTLDKALGMLAAWSPAFNRVLEGVPVLLARNGHANPRALRRACVPVEAFERELRTHQMRSIDAVDEARLEPNGKITVLKRE